MKKLIRLANGNVKVQTVNEEPSLTQQQFKEQSNINTIMKKYHSSGMITHINRRKGQYLDVSQLKDYQSSLQTVIDAQESFMTLPSEVRKKFANNPQQLISFLADPKNTDEAISLGLKKPKPPTPETIRETPKTPTTPPQSEPKK